MKKFLCICLAIITLMASSALLTACSCGDNVIVSQDGEHYYYRDWTTIVTYKLDGQQVNSKVNEDKSLAIQGIVNNSTKLEETPDCTFDDNFKFTMEEQTYYVAQDGCSILKNNGEYYSISVSDRHILNQIFGDYGAKDIYVKEGE